MVWREQPWGSPQHLALEWHPTKSTQILDFLSLWSFAMFIFILCILKQAAAEL